MIDVELTSESAQHMTSLFAGPSLVVENRDVLESGARRCSWRRAPLRRKGQKNIRRQLIHRRLVRIVDEMVNDREIRWLSGRTGYEIVGNVPYWIATALVVAAAFMKRKRAAVTS